MYKCYAEFEKAQEDETLRQLLPKSCDEFSNRNCISFITEMDRMRIRDESKSNLFRGAFRTLSKMKRFAKIVNG